MKKAGTLDDSSEKVTRLTELANELLTRDGNMDIYDETYEQIQKKINEVKEPNVELDMYADDFDSKEKNKLKDGMSVSEHASTSLATSAKKEETDERHNELMWEYKEQPEATEIHGPFTTEQMHNYSEEGRFSNGAFVRKVGATDKRFYSAARIDFDLYL